MFRMKNKSISEGESGKVLKYWGTYSVLAVTLGAMTFFGVCTPNGPTVNVSGNAAVVGSEKITMAEFRRAYRRQTDELKSRYQDRYDPAILRPAASALRQLVKDRVMYMTATDLGLGATDDEVVKYLLDNNAFQDKEGKFSQKNFENFLRYNNYSEATFLGEMQRNLSVQKLKNMVITATYASSKEAEFDYRISETKLKVDYLQFSSTDIKIPAPTKDEIIAFGVVEDNKKKIADWYNSHKSDYIEAEKVHARHVLVSFKGARNASGGGANRTKEAAQARAEKILAKLLVKGTDFATLAKKETDEPSGKESGGDLGFFTREAMVKQFSDVAFKLKVGAISPVTESPFGFHIIKVEAKKKARKDTLADSRDSISRKLLEKDRAPKILKDRANEVLALLKEKKSIAAKIKSYGLSWKSTGKFAANSSNIPGLGSTKEIQQKLLMLTKETPLVDSLMDIGSSKYIIRLIERTEPDMKKLDDDKIKEITRSSSFSRGYQYLTQLEKTEQKKFEDKKLISMNSKFLALDDPQSKQ